MCRYPGCKFEGPNSWEMYEEGGLCDEHDTQYEDWFLSIKPDVGEWLKFRALDNTEPDEATAQEGHHDN